MKTSSLGRLKDFEEAPDVGLDVSIILTQQSFLRKEKSV